MAIKVTWLSHSAFRLDVNETVILIDPYLTGNPLAAADPDEIPADYILITHGHSDHLGDAVDIARRTGAKVIGVWEIHQWMQQQGIENTHAQNIGGEYTHPFGRVKLVRADHSSAFPDGTYAGLACGIVLTINGMKLYFAGDTGLYSDMQLIGAMGIEAAFLPIGDNYTMGMDDSIQAVKWIHPRIVFPMHYNTFDEIQQDVATWARRVNNETGAHTVVLDPGQSFSL